ncbi:G2/mitotic-specific cyclin-4 [Daldinia childiae]|uniref:G2/mitotic-specific cyclin-4 n=1 Tax=Daldinia childiae TaxID=326645 RepID=UPI0014475A81|nr:G2/mitotic-specific cyclin-4 [Daldinia childiae]KAF3064892.1 G2/mitotic-specific cyclin-4 [Daldinia childiae]
MDARPSRFAYALSSRNDENLPPMANKTIHQRHKSTSNLMNAMSTAASFSKLAVKPNVQSDLDARAKPAPTNSYVPVIKHPNVFPGPINTDQENRNHNASKDAFLRPAQRLPKSLVPSASMNQLQSAANEPAPISKQQLQQHPIKKRGQPFKVFSDTQPEKEQPTLEKVNRAAITIKYSTQPQVEAKDWIPVASGKVLPEGRHQGSHLENPKKDVQNSNLPIAGRSEEVTEPVYLDAVEELPSNTYSVAKPEKEVGWKPDDLPAVTGQAMYPHYDERFASSAFPLRRYTADVSDDDEEDYYDDQGYTTAHSGRDNTTGGITTIMVPPKLTKKGAAEIAAAKDIVEKKVSSDVQDDEDWDISMVTEYGEDIFNYMKEMEIDLLPKPHYMDIQTEIKWSMRAVLMDWVIQVHTRFGLLPETLFLAVNYIDRFLSVKIVSIGKLQLVGATALLLAAKYEEINCPSVQEIVYMVDGGYNQEEVLKAERFMLSMLNFALGWPGPMSFLRRISKADDYDSEIRTVAKYFLEVTVMDERFVSSPPSYVAAGAQCLSRMILGKGDWTPEHVHYSGYTYAQLKPLIGMLFDCCRIGRKHHRAVFEKYSTRLFKRASPFVEEQIQNGFRLPFQRSYHYKLDVPTNEVHPGSYTMSMPLPMLG